MTTYDFESDDEGFLTSVLGGSVDLEYTFDNWIDPTTGTDYTYTFESSTEGFSTSVSGGSVTLSHTFDNWIDPSEGIDDSYTFEIDNISDYNIVDSINAYSTISISTKIPKKYLNPGNMVERRLLKRVDAIDDIYSVTRVRGEIR